MVTARSVNTALDRIRENSLRHRLAMNLFGDLVRRGKGLTFRFVAHKFDSKQKAEAANLTDVRMRFE